MKFIFNQGKSVEKESCFENSGIIREVYFQSGKSREKASYFEKSGKSGTFWSYYCFVFE